MRAALLRQNGPPESVELGEMAAPALGSNQVLVRVHASSVNPADYKVVSGRDGARFIHAMKFPMTFGYDFSGVVEAVGASATGCAVGDEVFGHLPYAMNTRQGAFAEVVAVKPESVALKPPGVSHEAAAVSATVGCTALQGLRDKGRLQSGQRVLINGASGGVGSFAAQIARIMGAEVSGTASAAKADFVRELGIHHVIDYRETPIESLRGTYDLVFDAASMSSYAKIKHMLARGGAYVTLLPSVSLLGGMAQSLFSNTRCTFVTVQSRRADLEQLGAWLASGELDPCIEESYALSEVAAALGALKSGGVRGKLAIRVAEL